MLSAMLVLLTDYSKVLYFHVHGQLW